MRSALVLDGRFRVFEDGTIFRIRNGVDIPAKTFDVGRASSKTKYKIVSYMENGKQKNIAVHRLVAIAFIPNPENKPEVNHINGDKSDNNVSNLEWVTRKENTQHAYHNGLMNPMKNGEPCIFCGKITRSKTGCCSDCLDKYVVVNNRIEKINRLKNKYKFFDITNLTEREAQCVSMAKLGESKTSIARELGLTRQRIDQLLNKAEAKQKGWARE